MKNKPLRFVITGTYSSFNKGDAAMQVSTAQNILKIWPDASISISSPFPQYDKDFYREYQVVKSSRRNLLLGSLQWLRGYLYTFIQNSLGIKVKRLVNNEELSLFNQADIIIDLSGDTLTEDYGPHVTYSHCLPLLLALSLKKPVFICAQSIGPFKYSTPLIKWVFKRVNHITAREEVTYTYLKQLLNNPHHLSQSADTAFLLEPASSNRINFILKQEKIILKKNTLGISISQLVEKRYNQKNPEAQKSDFATTMANILDTCASHLNLQILFISHVTGPSEEKDDRFLARRIYQLMKKKKLASVLIGDYRPEELKGIIGKCQVFLGARMHSNIGALSQRLPTLAFSYSHKTDGIMNTLNQKHNVFNIDTFKVHELYLNIEKTYKDKSKVKSILDTKMGQVRNKSRKNFQIIKNILNLNQ